MANDNGLFLPMEDFNKLPARSKLSVLYENQVNTLKLLTTQKHENSGIKFHQRIQYFIMTILGGGVIFLIKNATSM